MTDDAPPRRALLFEGSDRARLTVGDRTWEDVPVVPVDADAPEPEDLPPTVVLVRPDRASAVARAEGERHEEVELYLARIRDDEGKLEEVRVRVREVRERKPKGDPFWARVFKRGKST